MKKSPVGHQDRDRYWLLSSVYERLASLVFGQELVAAHRDLIEGGRGALAQCTELIWIGGGTGVLIEELLSAAPQATLTYIEPSKSMLKRAQSRVHQMVQRDQERVIWVNATHEWLYQRAQIDSSQTPAEDHANHQRCLLTVFFMDVLTAPQCHELMEWAREAQVNTWLFADFIVQTGWIKRAFIQWMYVCFMVTTQIKQRSLLDHLQLFHEHGWSALKESGRYRAHDLVFSALLTQEGHTSL